MTVTQPPEQIKVPFLKVERAKKHFNDLKGHIVKFQSKNPYSPIITTEIERQQYRVIARENESPPPELGIIAGDVLHNLRSALDNLACQLVIDNSSPITNKIEFPIVTAKKFKSALKGKVQGAHPKAVRLIKQLEPYEGGNDLLWLLHILNIHDKHRLSIHPHPILNEFWYPELSDRDRGNILVTTSQGALYVPLKDGTVLYRFRTKQGVFHDNVSVKPDLPFDVVFFKPKIAKLKPVLSTLDQIIGETQKALETFVPYFK